MHTLGPGEGDRSQGSIEPGGVGAAGAGEVGGEPMGGTGCTVRARMGKASSGRGSS